MNIEELPEYKKDLKKLLRRYPTLKQDMEVVKKVLAVSPERSPFSWMIKQLEITGCVIKGQKVACRALRGRGVHSGVRLIYALFGTESKIMLIELYHTSEKAAEDRQRILNHFK